MTSSSLPRALSSFSESSRLRDKLDASWSSLKSLSSTASSLSGFIPRILFDKIYFILVNRMSKWHLELGSEGHSFSGKAIVVNSKTGHHMSLDPVNMTVAKEVLKEEREKEAPAIRARARAEAASAEKKAVVKRKENAEKLKEWASGVHKKGEETREAHRAKPEPKKVEFSNDMKLRWDTLKDYIIKSLESSLKLGITKSMNDYVLYEIKPHPDIVLTGKGASAIFRTYSDSDFTIAFDHTKGRLIDSIGVMGGYSDNRNKRIMMPEDEIVKKIIVSLKSWELRDEDDKRFMESFSFDEDEANKIRADRKAKAELKKAKEAEAELKKAKEAEAELKKAEDAEAELKKAKEAEAELKKAKSDAKKAKILEAAAAKVSKPEGLSKEKAQELQEFIDTAPEDIAGHLYGKANKKGELQQGLISKMVGEDVTKQIVEACAGGNIDVSYAKLVGALFFLEKIANKQMDAWRNNRANTYDKALVVAQKGERSRPLVAEKGERSRAEIMTPADKLWNMCCRVLANHHKPLSLFSEPKNFERGFDIHMLLPGQKAVDLIKGQMPPYFWETVGHTSGMSGARDNYKWGIRDVNRKTTAGKVDYESRLTECSSRATKLLEHMKKALIGGAYLYLEKAEKAKVERVKAVKTSAAIQIPQGKKNALRITLTEENMYDIGLALRGDEAEALKWRERERSHIGQTVLLYKARTHTHMDLV